MAPKDARTAARVAAKTAKRILPISFSMATPSNRRQKPKISLLFFPLNRLIAFYDGYLLSDGMLLVFEYFDFIKV